MTTADRPWFIYVLRDPRSLEVRYVGVTVNPPGRLRQHCRSVLAGRSPADQWLLSLRAMGLAPIMEIIDEAPTDWEGAERKWIAHYRTRGAPLTNTHPGGAGGAQRTRRSVAARTPEEPTFLTVAEVANLFQVRPQTVLRLIHRGQIVAYHFGSYRIARADLEAFIAQRQTRQSPAAS